MNSDHYTLILALTMNVTEQRVWNKWEKVASEGDSYQICCTSVNSDILKYAFISVTRIPHGSSTQLHTEINMIGKFVMW